MQRTVSSEPGATFGYGALVQTLAVLSLKGGVGKTTAVLGLAGAALDRGLSTLVVDLDPQTNATVTLEPEATGRTLADVLADPKRDVVNAAIGRSAWSDDAESGGRLDVLVGTGEVAGHDHPEPGRNRLGRLRTALGRLDGQDGAPGPYDLVLIDCPPSLGQLTRSGLVAADRAMLIAEPSRFAVSGVRRAFEAVQNERDAHNPDLQPLGVVVNRVRPRSAEHVYRVDELRRIFGPLVLSPVLPERSAVEQAQGAAVPIQRWPTPGGREMTGAFDVLLERVLRSRSRRTSRR
jgi:cellulose biosynthesis protein BcsQ